MSFVQGHVEEASAKKALCRADTLLNMKHGLVRLDNVWGVGGGIRPVKYLVSSNAFYRGVCYAKYINYCWDYSVEQKEI